MAPMRVRLRLDRLCVAKKILYSNAMAERGLSSRILFRRRSSMIPRNIIQVRGHTLPTKQASPTIFVFVPNARYLMIRVKWQVDVSGSLVFSSIPLRILWDNLRPLAKLINAV